MNNLEFIKQLRNVTIVVEIIKLFVIIVYINYTYIKVINNENINIKKNIIVLVYSFFTSILINSLKYNINAYFRIIILIFIVSVFTTIIFREELIYSTSIIIISLAINYALFGIAISIAFIPNAILKIGNDYIALIIIIVIFSILHYMVFRSKKFKYGISFLQSKLENNYYNILFLNISVIILFLVVIMQDYGGLPPIELIFTFIIFAFSLYSTIKQFLKMYYKQNLLIKDLEQTKSELEAKKQEVEKLEKENLEFSKTSHSLAHKQKALEYKLEQLMKTSISKKDKDNIKSEIENISKEVYKEPQQIELPKTEIESIDNMFSYMQAECIKSNIKFELQVLGNIFYMINNLISENELEILIADHIKDAIIAIDNSNNINRSSLVRIGKIDNVYALYIYDSGIEFEKEVLENLGKKPITTHADSGGTGMGFMNTFDTLKRTKASLIINEIGKPCEDNYTKALIFKFDNKNEYIVNSYKNKVVTV